MDENIAKRMQSEGFERSPEQLSGEDIERLQEKIHAMESKTNDPK